MIGALLPAVGDQNVSALVQSRVEFVFAGSVGPNGSDMGALAAATDSFAKTDALFQRHLTDTPGDRGSAGSCV